MKAWIKTVFLGAMLFLPNQLSAQPSAFNFQGRLNDGSTPANGRYDLQFKLYDAIAGGNLILTVDRPNLLLINGVFSTTLDFGIGAFSGGSRFLETTVRPANSANAYVVLGERQQILSVPFTVRAISAANADNALNAQNSVNATNAQNSVNSTNALNAVNATTAQNSLSLAGVAASNYARLNFANQGDISAANISTTGYLSVTGNAVQTAPSFGVPKAMVYVGPLLNGWTIERCYNGVTGQTSGNCGFTLTTVNTGTYFINFGFPVNNHFVSVTPYNNSSPLVNYGANFRFNGSDLMVLTFKANDSSDTTAAPFMAVVY